jgi:histidine triad (HIT) family protein
MPLRQLIGLARPTAVPPLSARRSDGRQNRDGWRVDPRTLRPIKKDPMRSIVLLCLLGTASTLSAQGQLACIFCEIAAGKTRSGTIVYQDDLVVAFMDRAPRNPGHVLVIPIQHAEGILDVPAPTVSRMAAVAQKIATAIKRTDLKADGFNLQSNTGRAAGQSVFHLHLHVIPRFVGEPPYEGEKNIAPPEEVAAVAKKLREVLAREPK